MKKINVLMVQPKTPPTFWTLDSAIKSIGYKSVMPPLGLMTIAAMLPENYNIKLTDLNLNDISINDIDKSDIVFITGMNIHRQSFVKTVELCHKSGKTIVAGGPFVISSYAKGEEMDVDCPEFKMINHFILYEAEVNLPAFLRDYELGSAKRIYDNKDKPDLALTPIPRFDLVNIKDYASMSLQFSRGCPFNCEFCDIIQMFGRIPRTKSTTQFISEMDALYSTGYRGRLFVVDDNFIGNKKAVKELLGGIITWQQERSYPFLMYTEASVDLAQDDELLYLMVRAGFTSVFLGIETPDPESLKAINKRQNTRYDMDAGIEKIQRSGMEVMGGFIVGFDSDTEDIFRRQIDFINRNAIVQCMVGVLSAMPNTDLYRRLEREGRLINLGDQNSGDNFDVQLDFIPKMPVEILIRGYIQIIREVFNPADYFSRALTLVSRLPDLGKSGLKNADPWRRELAKAKLYETPKNIKVLSGIFSLLLSSYGLHVFLFLVKSLRYGVRSLPVTFNLAFRGRHYYNISRNIISRVNL